YGSLVFLSLAHQNSQLFYTKFNDSPHLIPRVYLNKTVLIIKLVSESRRRWENIKLTSG
ncbi:MAG: hypothetical protein XD97_0572, partial [Pelotomaculum thermopropionicum]